MRDNRSIETTNNNPVTFAQDTVREDNINRRSKTFNDLDFEDCAFQLGEVHETVTHPLLSQIYKEHDHIGDTFASDSGCWDQRNVTTQILVFIVKARVQSFLGESNDGLGHTVLEFTLNGASLLSQRLLEGAIRSSLPTIHAIDLDHSLVNLSTNQKKKALNTLLRATINGVLRSLSNRRDSNV